MVFPLNLRACFSCIGVSTLCVFFVFLGMIYFFSPRLSSARMQKSCEMTLEDLLVYCGHLFISFPLCHTPKTPPKTTITLNTSPQLIDRAMELINFSIGLSVFLG